MNLILWMMLLSGMVWLYGEFWAKQTAGKVSWSIKVEGDRHREGQEVSLWAHVENHSWLPIFWIHITQPLPEGLWIQEGDKKMTTIYFRTYLLPRQRVKRRFHLMLHTRGPKRWERASAVFGDGTGFKRVKEMLDPEVTIRVRPNPSPQIQLEVQREALYGEQTIRRWFHEDPTRLSGIRPFMKGDSYRQIHWAATARSGELMVKQFEPTSQAHFYVILNHQFHSLHLVGGSKEIIDHQCRLAAGLFHYALEQGFSMGLYTNASWAGRGRVTVPIGNSSNQLETIMEALAGALYLPDSPFTELLVSLRGKLEQGSTLIIITPYWDQEIMEKVEWLRGEGHQIILCLSDPQVDKKLLPPWIPVIPAYLEKEEGIR